MGTNYYYHKPEIIGYSVRHIGKSSHGWPFMLHVEPDAGLNTLEEWVAHIESTFGDIVDEYKKKISVEKLLLIVSDRICALYPKVDGAFCTEYLPVQKYCKCHGEFC